MSRLARTSPIALMPLLLLAVACAPPTAAKPYPSTEPPEGEIKVSEEPLAPTVVRLFEREVDLGPFLAGFPYSQWMPSLEHGRLYYVEAGDRYVLRSLPLASADQPVATLDLAAGEVVTEVDWSTRSLWSVRTHAPTNTLWLHADARNDEQMNLWRLDLGKPAAERMPEPITHADYVYGWGFSEDQARIAYLARTGQQAPYRTCLRLLDANDPTREGADQEMVCDSPALSFTWGSPRFSPDGKQVYFVAQVDGDRKRVQIVEVDLRSEVPVAKPITNTAVPRSSPALLDGWVDDDNLLYVADDNGYGDIYRWNRRTRKTKRLTAHDEELLGAEVQRVGDRWTVLVAHGTPAGSTLASIDALSGALIGDAIVPGKVAIQDAFEGRAIWTREAPDRVFEANLLSFAPAQTGAEPELRNEPLIRLPATLDEALVRCVPEAVTIPSFDGLALHAYVLRPKQPLTDHPPIAMVRSFYGGDNEWNRYDQILCAAGITVVSPAVRGSSGFGAAFQALNDRDLGGDEIVDLFWVARWIERELQIPSSHIGVYGRSHGGYATMRAMTFPPATNARNESYTFGFGLAEAGFSDIAKFHAATNIPDWVVLEAGDPAVPADLERLRDRSPINHVDLLQAPLFLLHGGNDWRVPVEGSRSFADAAKAAGKQVSYVEIAGQGHHIEGQERVVEAWQARLSFIEAALEAR